MSTERRSKRYLRNIMLLVGLVLPTLTLVPLGGLWLWERGLSLYWAAGAALSVIGIWLWQRHLLREPIAMAERAAGEATPPDIVWTPAESKAWEQVQRIARELDPDTLTSRDEVLALGKRTVEAVARTLHPEEKDPLLRFTVPEALALVEQVSRELRPLIIENIPLGDRLTVGQVAALYDWRWLIGGYEKVYDVWRVIRMLNPAAAAAQEVREQVTKQMVKWGKDRIVRTLAERYVEEVGRAAIDLYGGRLKVTDAELTERISDLSRRDRAAMAARLAEPLRILIAGPLKSGKSSLVNLLTGTPAAGVDTLPASAAFEPHEFSRQGIGKAVVLDSPGIDSDADLALLLAEAEGADLVIWTTSAVRAGREPERLALTALRDRFAGFDRRKMPPVVVALTHCDRLRPAGEWQPPYDLEADTAGTGKVGVIREAVATVASDLEVEPDRIVPLALAPAVGEPDIEPLWAKILLVLPEARAAQLGRLRTGAAMGFWRRLWTQTRGAGRLIRRELSR